MSTTQLINPATEEVLGSAHRVVDRGGIGVVDRTQHFLGGGVDLESCSSAVRIGPRGVHDRGE